MPKKVLLIEDSSTDRELLRALLELKGYEIHEAADGISGIEKALEHMPDLIVLDVTMPGMSGFETAQRIRDDPKIKHIPILMCTGKSKMRDAEKGLAWGANDYIAKPFQYVQFQAKVDRLLSASP